MARRKSTTTATAPEAKAAAPVATHAAEQAPESFVGRLCADPVLRTTKTGKSVCTIRLALVGEAGESTQFISCVTWNRTAEVVAQYKRKGHAVHVEGRSAERTWTDRDGTERRTTEVSTYRVQFLSRQASSPAVEQEVS